MAKIKVLIVEDEALVAIGLAMLIEELGFDVLGPCARASDAAALSAASPPDIAVVDLNLLDGPTGVKLAADLAQRHGTKVIVSSATPDGLREGHDGVVKIVRKPCDEETIGAALSWVASLPAEQMTWSSSRRRAQTK